MFLPQFFCQSSPFPKSTDHAGRRPSRCRFGFQWLSSGICHSSLRAVYMVSAARQAAATGSSAAGTGPNCAISGLAQKCRWTDEGAKPCTAR